MDNIAGTKSRLTWAVHISVAALVLLWLFPTVGLFVSSFRTADQISSSGWWAALAPSEQIVQLRTGGRDVAIQEDGVFVVTGNLLTDGDGPGTTAEITAFGVSSRAIGAYTPGETADAGEGEELTLNADGSYRLIGRGSGKAVAVSDESYDGGANVFQWGYNGRRNFHWQLEAV